MVFKQTAFTIVGIFLITQTIGLYIGNQYVQAIKSEILYPVFENPESVENSFILFFYIIVATVIMLLMIKYWKFSLKLFEAFAILFSSWVTFDFLIPIEIGYYLSLGFFLALTLTLWKMLRPTILSQNIAAIFAGSGVGALLGASFGMVPSLVFLLILCVYDFVSVFITKHMITLAKEVVKTPTAFTVAAPHKFKKAKYVGVKGRKKRFHIFQLGLGDIVMPLMFSISLLNKFNLMNSIFSVVGSTIALTLLIYYMSKKPKPLPALPFIGVGTLSGFLISLIL